MQVHGTIRSPHLRSLLQFYAEKHKLPLAYAEGSLQGQSGPFSNRAEIIAPDSGEETLVELPLGSRVLAVTTHSSCASRGSLVETAPGHPVAAVDGYRLLLFLPLGRLFESLGRVRVRPVRGSMEELDLSPSSALAELTTTILDQAMPLLKEAVEEYSFAEEKRRYAAIKVKAMEERMAQLRDTAEECRRQADHNLATARKLLREGHTARRSLEVLEQHTLPVAKRRAEEELEALVKLVPRPYNSIVFDDDGITAKTYGMVVSHGEVCVELGPFVVKIPFESEGELTMWTTGEEAEGYPHPHVDSDGHPCLGNLGTGVEKLLVEGEYAALLNVCIQFLAAYNRDNPFVELEKWDPDYMARDRYESCRDTADYRHDCVECADSNCPWWDDRHERCYEEHECDECIECGACPNSERAERRCRRSQVEGGVADRCADCTLPCRYAVPEEEPQPAAEAAAGGAP